MKLFISSDIEGTCGINDWDETEIGKPGYDRFAMQMSREVSAACSGALETSKVEDILVKDAHDSARNIIGDELPEGVHLIRGWVTNPGSMMSGVRQCDAAAMTGYHSGAYSIGNNLSHTMNLRNQYIEVNGKYASEFMLNSMFAAYYGIPTIFVSGDKALCEEAKELIPEITTVPVFEGWGTSTISIHPKTAIRLIHDGMKEAISKDPRTCLMTLPEHFHVEIEFKDMEKAQRGSYYPGVTRVGSKRIAFDSEDYYEVTRTLYFIL